MGVRIVLDGPRAGPWRGFGRAAAVAASVLWVPETPSTSCNLGVFMDDAAKAIAPLDLELI